MSSKENPTEDKLNKQLNTIVIVQMCIVVVVFIAVVLAIILFLKTKALAKKHEGISNNVLVSLENVTVPKPINLSELNEKIQNVLSDKNVQMVKDIGERIQREKAIENIKKLKDKVDTIDFKSIAENISKINKSLTKITNPISTFKNYLAPPKIPIKNETQGLRPGTGQIESGTLHFDH